MKWILSRTTDVMIVNQAKRGESNTWTRQLESLFIFLLQIHLAVSLFNVTPLQQKMRMSQVMSIVWAHDLQNNNKNMTRAWGNNQLNKKGLEYRLDQKQHSLDMNRRDRKNKALKYFVWTEVHLKGLKRSKSLKSCTALMKSDHVSNNKTHFNSFMLNASLPTIASAEAL